MSDLEKLWADLETALMLYCGSTEADHIKGIVCLIISEVKRSHK